MSKLIIHNDFKNSRFIYAPTSNIGVKFLNALNIQGVKRMHFDNKLLVSNFTIEASDGYKIPVDRYEPKEPKANRPCIIYFHGGGFRIKGSALVARNLEEYALKLDAICLMIDYRLLPEYSYPRPFLDAYESLLWVNNNAKALGVDNNRIAVAGASAGGNLTAAVALKARDEQSVSICHQMLIYPALDYKQEQASIERYKKAPIWNKKKNQSMWEAYLKNAEDTDIWYGSPMYHVSHENLPPTYIEVAQYDCLFDEGRLYGKLLKAANNYVEMHMVKGGVHGYDNYINSKYIDIYVDRRIDVWHQVFYGGEDSGK